MLAAGSHSFHTNKPGCFRLETPCCVFVLVTLAMKHGDQYCAHVADFLQPGSAIVKPVSAGFLPERGMLAKILHFGIGRNFA